MPLRTKAELGQWNVECTSCGGYYKQREIERNPNTGALVCFTCQEPYDILPDFVPSVPVSRPVHPIQGPTDEIPQEDWMLMVWNGTEYIPKRD